MAQYSLSVERGAFAHCEKGTGCVEVSATVPRARAKELSLPLLISPETFRERASAIERDQNSSLFFPRLSFSFAFVTARRPSLSST